MQLENIGTIFNSTLGELHCLLINNSELDDEALFNMFLSTPRLSNFRRSFGLFLSQSHGEAKSKYKRQDSALDQEEINCWKKGD